MTDLTNHGEHDVPDAKSQSCVYVYRNRSGKIVYVGRGASPQRALSHASGSHNPRLAELIAGGDYDLEIAGPYDDYATAEEVEAALISVLTRPGTHALVNDVPGHGHRFRPLGVPPEFADRRLEPALKVSDIGRATGGALIVRNSFGGELEPGRPRLDPLHIDPSILIDNLRRYWQLNRLHTI